MAIHAHSTTAPALQPRLLRSFASRPTPPIDDPRSADELLEEIRRTIEGQESVVPANGPLSAEESTARQPCDISRLTQKETLASTAAKGLLRADVPRGVAGCVDTDIPFAARALHKRRELHQALDYGFALLDALDLPPLALDFIDDAIATLDALEAPYEDREEDDPAEGTALETAGRGFTRYGGDDDEDGLDIEEQHDAEQTYEDGSEDELDPWRFRPDAWALSAEAHHV